MYVLLVGLNHRTAPIEVRECVAFSGESLDRAYRMLKNAPEIEGAVILATCNRTEVYATAKDVSRGIEFLEGFLAQFSGFAVDKLKKHLYQPNCYDAIMHLFRVAAGLDSMILGEAQILSQVKEAYQTAVQNGASDRVLNALFQKAINVGKKVRTDTAIDRHSLSVSYAAVELARSTLGELAGKTVLVLGAGEMSELTTRYLMANGVQTIIVSNRSYARADSLARELNGRAVHFDQLASELINADIVISCTAAAHYVIKGDSCLEALSRRQGRKIIMIDIAVPRDIDPVVKEIEGVYLYDIDDIQNVVDNNLLERKKAALQANKIIAEEIRQFNQWLAGLYVVPIITELKAYGESVKENEIRKALNRLGNVSEREEKIIRTMAHSIVNQLLHTPIATLKEMAPSNQGHLYAEVAKSLFSLHISSWENQSYAQTNSRD